MRKSVLLVGLLLAGCAARNVYLVPPVVDMTGVDPVKYQNELSACTKAKIEANKTTVITNEFISDCMASKGYTILQAQG